MTVTVAVTEAAYKYQGRSRRVALPTHPSAFRLAASAKEAASRLGCSPLSRDAGTGGAAWRQWPQRRGPGAGPQQDRANSGRGRMKRGCTGLGNSRGAVAWDPRSAGRNRALREDPLAGAAGQCCRGESAADARMAGGRPFAALVHKVLPSGQRRCSRAAPGVWVLSCERTERLSPQRIDHALRKELSRRAGIRVV